MNKHDETPHFAGLCEAESCWTENWDYVAPGRIGQRRADMQRGWWRLHWQHIWLPAATARRKPHCPYAQAWRKY